MGTRHPELVTAHTADGAIAPYRIAVHGAADGNVAQAANSTTPLMGIVGRIAPAVANDRVDVTRSGIEEVEYGGTVTRGDPLTADASGRAITAAPGAGVNAYVIGNAEESGVVGQIGSCHIAPGRIQG